MDKTPWTRAMVSGHSTCGFFVRGMTKQKMSLAPVNYEGELRNRNKTAAQIVQDKLSSLKVTARKIGRELETKADNSKTNKLLL